MKIYDPLNPSFVESRVIFQTYRRDWHSASRTYRRLIMAAAAAVTY